MRRLRGWSRRRVALLSVALLVLVVLVSHPVRVAILAIALLPSAIQALPFDPLAQFTPVPDRETLSFPYEAGTVEADVYSPNRGGRHGALILLLGARPVPKDDPILVRFAEGLGRTGLVVMIPASSGLVAGQVTLAEVDAVAREVDLLRAREDVDPARIGILGFSVGGSVAVLSAADPRLAGKLVLVNAFGSYNDTTDLVRAASTRSLKYAGVDQPWEPHPVTLWVIARQLVDTLPDPTDQDVLDRLYLQGDDSAREDVAQMTTAGKAALGLLGGLSPADTEAALAQLPTASLQRLREVSPSTVLDRVNTRLFIMHDVGDHYIPYTESQRMAAGTPAATLERFAQFDLFDHVTPNHPPTDLAFYVELGRLLRQLYGILLYVL